MSTVATSITKIRRTLQDANGTNYASEELYDHYNQAIKFLSQQLAQMHSRIAVSNTTLSYAEHAYYASLPSDFLALAMNEKGKPRVFNASNSYERLTMVEPDAMDDWESESNADDGTVGEFIISGAYMYVHPRANAATTIKIYYHPLSTITDSLSTMPWSDWFNEPVEQFVIRQCRLRSEMFGYSGPDVADYERLKDAAMDILRLRENNYISLIPTPGVGWTS